ncbi:hypothetical protein CC86DRAFT_56463 [Ophiobolus disseminans]|uniref:Uncharacterized protein n=1 Tax=Ophiobolus disseminans TaxID=1469910 RepID=A0A6A6ZVK8_9PLEO|nr:hypothetical protein CC86DRAFT_56463 [Ophiobolus disseminans]
MENAGAGLPLSLRVPHCAICAMPGLRHLPKYFTVHKHGSPLGLGGIMRWWLSGCSGDHSSNELLQLVMRLPNYDFLQSIRCRGTMTCSFPQPRDGDGRCPTSCQCPLVLWRPAACSKILPGQTERTGSMHSLVSQPTQKRLRETTLPGLAALACCVCNVPRAPATSTFDQFISIMA